MKKKVLVIDDDESIKEILNLILKTLGYNFFPADDWGEVVDLLQNEDFNILFTDFRMPAMVDPSGVRVRRAFLF